MIPMIPRLQQPAPPLIYNVRSHIALPRISPPYALRALGAVVPRVASPLRLRVVGIMHYHSGSWDVTRADTNPGFGVWNWVFCMLQWRGYGYVVDVTCIPGVGWKRSNCLFLLGLVLLVRRGTGGVWAA